MLNFAVGPVMMDDVVLNVGSQQIPYFRTSEFSKVMLENEKIMKALVNGADNARCVFITGSGTASMEATVASVLSEDDKVLVVNGGSFGQRFVDLCKIYQIPFEEIIIERGEYLTKEKLEQYEGDQYTAFLVNLHETSRGVLYDIDSISNFCKKNRMLLIVDAISSFLADNIDMMKSGIDVMIIGSQKALACPPGVSAIMLSSTAQKKIAENKIRGMYLNLQIALKDGERGQTPFTPAVGILLQINARLRQIMELGGKDREIQRVAELANDFRSRIVNLPLEIASEHMSNAVTPIHPLRVSAYEVFRTLKDEYGIWICPNGGKLADEICRVGHIGKLTKEDNTKLIQALENMVQRGLL